VASFQLPVKDKPIGLLAAIIGKANCFLEDGEINSLIDGRY
jgi:hypothetical protein